MTYECTEERFLADIKNHKMKVLMDNNVYRHLRFSSPETNSYYFDIVTYPNNLVIGGDMGGFCSSRLYNMFDFYRTDNNDFNKNKNGLSINPSYWNEKIVAGREETKEFSIDGFKKIVNEYIDSSLDGDDWSEYEIDELRDDILSEIKYCDDNSVRLFDLINDYNFEGDSGRTFQFTDWWGYHSNAEVYKFHYIWQCYAIAYAVQEYDKFKQQEGSINLS